MSKIPFTLLAKLPFLTEIYIPTRSKVEDRNPTNLTPRFASVGLELEVVRREPNIYMSGPELELTLLDGQHTRVRAGGVKSLVKQGDRGITACVKLVAPLGLRDHYLTQIEQTLTSFYGEQ
jgi:hypothetical protein